MFLYHGYEKVVGTGKDWGSTWATTLWREQGKVPKEFQDKLTKISEKLTKTDENKDGVPSEHFKAIESELSTLYSRETKLPSALETHWAQLAVAWGELLGGAALLLGFLTRLAALGLIVIQAGAIYTVTWARGFSFAAGGGYEFNVAIAAMCVALVFLGGGKLALSYCLGGKPPPEKPA
jgi:uncharacterized membrane protein YphA (DoxX/SURF4 family)